ncbi:MAG: hypothetical protein ACK55A_05445, partial [Gemmatimonas sp.]
MSRAPSAPLRIALAGCGHVGGSLLDLLTQRRLAAAPGPDVQVQRVLVRHAALARPAFARAVHAGLAATTALTADVGALLDDDI